jgi:phosphatidylglycerophosphatase A
MIGCVPNMTEQSEPQNRFSPVLLLATGLGFGYSPIAPGSFGALWGLPWAWSVMQIPATGPLPAWTLHLLVIAITCAAGVPLCSAAARQLGGEKDPSAVVFDEIATMPIVLLFVSTADLHRPWVWGAAFLLHRVFDISKLPPCRQLERLPQGLGIMADDVVAALYACGVLHLVLWLTHSLASASG